MDEKLRAIVGQWLVKGDNDLDLNEWQLKGIQDALIEADRPDAVFEDHDDVLAKWESTTAFSSRLL